MMQKSKTLIVVFLLGLIVTAGRYYILHQSDNSILNLDNQILEFQISSDPMLVAERFGGDLSLQTDIFTHADVIHRGMNFPVALTIDDSNSELSKALPTSKWSCRLRLKIAPANRRYVAFASCLDEPKLTSSETRLQTIAGGFRTALQNLTYQRVNSDASTLLPGLVIGDNQAQSKELVENLQLSGLGHLTAVSGANVAILLLFVQFILQRTQISDNWRFVILLIVLAMFVIVARPSPSVVRAAMMAAIALLYWIKGFQKLSEGILFLAVFVLLFVDPWLAMSWGFALSAAATLGLILLPRYWNVDANSSFYVKAFSTAFAASIATLPILLAMGNVVTLATIPANILAEIMVAPATIFGLIAPILSFIPLLSPLAAVAANLAMGCAAVIVLIAETLANSVFAIEILSLRGVFVMVLAVFVYRMRTKKLLLISSGLIAVLIFLGASKFENRWQISDWEIAVCDIGQGDATLIRTSENAAMVVDVGPDSRLMKKCLQTFGISRIDLFVASHFHADHVGAVSGLVEISKPARVITAALAAPGTGVEVVEQAISPTQREIAKVGMTGELGDEGHQVSWQVLAPASSPNHVEDSNGSLINNNSVVLLVTTLHHRILLTGDIEIEAQEKLMQTISNPNVDLVKVPHHGSAYQAPDFAKWANPKIAWISVAEENSYGHPNPTTVLLYQVTGAEVLTTSKCGHITFANNAFSTSRPCV